MEKDKWIPKKLAEKQELQRQQSINIVLRAIEDIKAEHKKVTITALMEFTELSRTVFSKAHIRELLVNYRYSEKNDTDNKQKRKNKKTVVWDEKDKQIQKLRLLNNELQKECEILRGRVFLLTQK